MAAKLWVLEQVSWRGVGAGAGKSICQGRGEHASLLLRAPEYRSPDRRTFLGRQKALDTQ